MIRRIKVYIREKGSKSRKGLTLFVGKIFNRKCQLKRSYWIEIRLLLKKANFMKPNISKLFISTFTIGLAMLLVLAGTVLAQVNSGSNGSDLAFNPTQTNTVINMADHSTGIYQYTSVNIPTNVTVTFTPNVNNTPVVWLVQTNCVISGTVNVAGQDASATVAGLGGPGGFRGGNGGSNGTSGQGPGAGGFSSGSNPSGGPASYGTLGSTNCAGNYGTIGTNYGNTFLIPLLGGSGGGGSGGVAPCAGAGGGGALLIAASGNIQLNGQINAKGGGHAFAYAGGDGSGGAIRLIASSISGTGQVYAAGGHESCISAGNGRVRFDTYLNNFVGTVDIGYTNGSNFVIIPTSGQGTQLTITSVGGVSVSASPSGIFTTPDAILSAQQNNPIPVVVSCANLPLNTQITVTVTPVNGIQVSATGYNNSGTLASSTATVSIIIPRGGGLISASAATSP